MSLTAGIDVGSTYTKGVLLDGNGAIVGRAIGRSGFRLTEVARRIFDEALADAGVGEDAVHYVVTTGYGR
ncbi:MAG: BadF/BadG/BcrA/BcrD ATPase family protein, partial [Thermoanaerobaculia bacterium]